jgi:hypothetical protein
LSRAGSMLQASKLQLQLQISLTECDKDQVANLS